MPFSLHADRHGVMHVMRRLPWAAAGFPRLHFSYLFSTILLVSSQFIAGRWQLLATLQLLGVLCQMHMMAVQKN